MVSKDAGQIHFLDSMEISIIRNALWYSVKNHQSSDFDKYNNKEKELYDLFNRLDKECNSFDCYALIKAIEPEFRLYDSYSSSGKW